LKEYLDIRYQVDKKKPITVDYGLCIW